jgi:heme/copper-type cytochrome/quinol oxidase subunit 2
MKRAVVLTGVIALLLVAGIILMTNTNNSTTGSAVSGKTILEEEKVFRISGSHLRFYIDGVENPDMVVNEGDRVIIEYTGEEGFHDWVVDELQARTEKVPAGQTARTEFIATKKGTFEYYCSVGKHRENGMKGRFIVE